MLEKSGYRAVPSPRQPGPGDQRYYRWCWWSWWCHLLADQRYYRGGFITQTHGSHHGGEVDAIQMEVKLMLHWVNFLWIELLYHKINYKTQVNRQTEVLTWLFSSSRYQKLFSIPGAGRNTTRGRRNAPNLILSGSCQDHGGLRRPLLQHQKRDDWKQRLSLNLSQIMASLAASFYFVFSIQLQLYNSRFLVILAY